MAYSDVKIVLILFLLVSCNGYEETAVDLEADYQPLEIGKFWEYEVEETVFFGEGDAETEIYFYKDQIMSVYVNEVGEPVFVATREKSFDRQTWASEKKYTYRISKGALLKSMDNETYIPFVFPPGEGKQWDANAYSSLSEDKFQMVYHADFVNGSGYHGPAFKVVQNEEDDLITLRDNRFEVFVKNIGMVESYYEVLTYCSRTDCLGQQLIDSGRFTRLRLINHG